MTMPPIGTSPDAYGMRPGWPNCAKCGNRWDDLLVFLSNCPKCGTAIPDAPIAQAPAKEQPGEQNAGPTQRKEPEVMVANLSGAPAPDVAAMVNRLRDQAVTMLATGYENVGLDTIDLLREAAALIEKLGQGWIPVSERTPEAQYDVLVTDGEIVGIGDCCKGHLWNAHTIDGAVTHWRPLPPPPERP